MVSGELFPHTYEGNERVFENEGKEFEPEFSSEVWCSAQTLQQFGELTAEWLEGRVGHLPTSAYYSHPNEETMALLPYINPLNRSGILVSTFSQPGCTSTEKPFGGIMDEQRAAFGGFMDEQHLDALAREAESWGIVMTSSPPNSPHKSSSIVVSRLNREDMTFTGHVMSSEDIAIRYGGVEGMSEIPGLDPEMIKVLQNSHQVELHDPEWGRNERLWPMLQRFYESQSSVASSTN